LEHSLFRIQLIMGTYSHKYDVTNRIIDYEMGHLDDMGTLRLFSELVKTGMAWTLQGHYGRTAQALINDGWLEADGNFGIKVDTLPLN
jgi:hypothetical protein